MRSIITFFVLFSLSLVTTACNTMQGMGKDIKKGGENLEKTADQHKH